MNDIQHGILCEKLERINSNLVWIFIALLVLIALK